MKEKKSQFYSLNDDESLKPKSKGKQRMSKFYLGGKQNELADDIEDNTLVGTSTSTSNNSPLRPIGSEDSILQLKAHAEEVVSHHAQRLSETTQSNSSGSPSTSTSTDNVPSGVNIDNRLESDYSTTDEEDLGLPLPATTRPKTSILGNLLDLYAHKLVAPAQSTPASSTQTKSPLHGPAAPEPARIPLAPLNRQNNQSGDTLRSAPSSPTSIPAARSRSNSLPDENAGYPPISPAWQKRRKSQPLRLNLNAFSGGRGPLTPVDEDAPTKNRSRSSSIDSNTSFTSVNHLLKSFPNHSNFHRVTDFDENDDAHSPGREESFPFQKLTSPRSSVDSGQRDTNPLLNGQTHEDCDCELPNNFNGVSQAEIFRCI